MLTNRSQIDPEPTPKRPQNDPESTPNRPQIDPKSAELMSGKALSGKVGPLMKNYGLFVYVVADFGLFRNSPRIPANLRKTYGLIPICGGFLVFNAYGGYGK